MGLPLTTTDFVACLLFAGRSPYPSHEFPRVAVAATGCERAVAAASSRNFNHKVHKPDPVSRCGHALRVFRFSLFPDVYVLGIHHLQRQATQEKDEKISHDR